MQEFSNWGPGTPTGPQGGARGSGEIVRLKEKWKMNMEIKKNGKGNILSKFNNKMNLYCFI